MNSILCLKTLSKGSKSIINYIEELPKITDQVIQNCEKILTEEIYGKDISKDMLYKIDQLSNECCKIYDSSTILRTTFLYPTYEEATRKDYKKHMELIDKVTSKIDSFFAKLNTEKALYDKIVKIKNSDLHNTLSSAEKIFVERMINELQSYQKGNKLMLDQVAATISRLMNKFMINMQNQEFDITLTKDELKLVSSSLRKYFEELQGKDKDVYSLKGDRSILNILKFSSSPQIREKFFTSVSESTKQNIPILLQILYSRQQKAQMLGYDNSIELLRSERAFKIDSPIEAVENSRAIMRHHLNESIDIIKHLSGEKDYNISNCIFDKDYIKSKLEMAMISNQERIMNLNGVFTPSNLLNGLMLMITKVFDCQAKMYTVVIDKDLNITEKEIKRTGNPTLEELKNDENEMTLMDDPDKAYLFRIEIEHKGRHSEIYIDLFNRYHKANGSNATFTVQGSAKEGDNDYQKPIVYMMNSIGLDQPYLNFNQVRNAFHELGHAMHIALSTTSFQFINGARVPIDFAEIPSNFTEQFIYDYDFVKQWAVNTINQPISKEVFNKVVLKERITELVDMEETSYFSLLDLKFHSLKYNELSEKNLNEINAKLLPNKSQKAIEYDGSFNHKYFLTNFKELDNATEYLQSILNNVYKDSLSSIFKRKESIDNKEKVEEIDQNDKVLKDQNEYEKAMSASLCLLFALPNYEASYYTYYLAKQIGVLMHNLRKTESQKLPDEILEIYEKGGEYDPDCLLNKIL